MKLYLLDYKNNLLMKLNSKITCNLTISVGSGWAPDFVNGGCDFDRFSVEVDDDDDVEALEVVGENKEDVIPLSLPRVVGLLLLLLLLLALEIWKRFRQEGNKKEKWKFSRYLDTTAATSPNAISIAACLSGDASWKIGSIDEVNWVKNIKNK